jgi:hypothetical protein
MDIRIVSTLTSEDEKGVAGALLKALLELLNGLPIAYVVRIETSGADVLHGSNMDPGATAIDGLPDPIAIR